MVRGHKRLWWTWSGHKRHLTETGKYKQASHSTALDPALYCGGNELISDEPRHVISNNVAF